MMLANRLQGFRLITLDGYICIGNFPAQSEGMSNAP